MSWGEVFFGFHGRINRRTFWAGWIAANVAGVLLMALLAWLVTGDPVSTDVWLTPADKKNVWVPVWGAWLAVLAWPLAALAAKRLHDRELPAWLWYAYYCVTIVFSMPPLKNLSGPELPSVIRALMPLLLIFGIFVFTELAILRGTRGPNVHGADTLPADYHGGDYDFLSLMLAWEGRIGRAKWWFGVGIDTVAVTLAIVAAIFAAEAFFARHPELEANMAHPDWLSSADAQPLLFRMALWTAVPLAVIVVAVWSLLALSVKRLHDRGLSSWLILVVILPLLATIMMEGADIAPGLGESMVQLPAVLLLASLIWGLLQFGILKGQAGANNHGPDPLEGQG
jgi:uncharacterized membrane protein YhaH (DUF805 family)